MAYVTPGAGALVAVRPGQASSPRGAGGNVPVYQIDFTAVASGKRIASTKRRVRWRFGFANLEALENGETGTACRGEEHDITLVWSVTSGKRLVLADGHEVHYSNNRNQIFEFSWTMRGNHVLKVIAYSSPPISVNPGFRQYDFFVDGQSFFSMPKVYRLGLNGATAAVTGAPNVPPPVAHRSPTYSNYTLSENERPKTPLSVLEAPRNTDEERIFLEEAIKASLVETSSVSGAEAEAAPAPAPAPQGIPASTALVAAQPPDHNEGVGDLLDFGGGDTNVPAPAPVPSVGGAVPQPGVHYSNGQNGYAPGGQNGYAPQQTMNEAKPEFSSGGPQTFQRNGSFMQSNYSVAPQPSFDATGAQNQSFTAPAPAPPSFGAPSAQNSATPNFGAPSSQTTAAPDFGAPSSQNSAAPNFGAPSSQSSAAPNFGGPPSQPSANPFSLEQPQQNTSMRGSFVQQPTTEFTPQGSDQTPQGTGTTESLAGSAAAPTPTPNVFAPGYSSEQQENASIFTQTDNSAGGSLADQAYSKLASADFGLAKNPFDVVAESTAPQPSLSGMKAMQPQQQQQNSKPKEIMKAPPAAAGSIVLANTQQGNWGGMMNQGGPPPLSSQGVGFGAGAQPQMYGGGGYQAPTLGGGYNNGYGGAPQMGQQAPPQPQYQQFPQGQQSFQQPQQYQQPMQQQQPQQGYGAPQFQQQY